MRHCGTASLPSLLYPKIHFERCSRVVLEVVFRIGFSLIPAFSPGQKIKRVLGSWRSLNRALRPALKRSSLSWQDRAGVRGKLPRDESFRLRYAVSAPTHGLFKSRAIRVCQNARHLRGVGGTIHGHRLDARHRAERFLQAHRAMIAGHALDAEGDCLKCWRQPIRLIHPGQSDTERLLGKPFGAAWPFDHPRRVSPAKFARQNFVAGATQSCRASWTSVRANWRGKSGLDTSRRGDWHGQNCVAAATGSCRTVTALASGVLPEPIMPETPCVAPASPR